MEKFVVKGGEKLSGDVQISTAKNAVLPIMAATILCASEVVINNPPFLKDVNVMCKLLSSIGVNLENNTFDKSSFIKLNTSNIYTNNLDNNLVNEMRASFLLMGPMIATKGRCRISMPGGCKIGKRPIDLHLKGFEKLGVIINEGEDYIEARTNKLIGNYIKLDYPSVGATENILMAACLANGNTIIENAAREPEIIDLVNFLNSMGAKINGAGKKIIKVTGVTKLHGGTYTPIPDRIEACTFLIAALITNSKLRLKGIDYENVRFVCDILKSCGAIISEDSKGIIINGQKEIMPINILTGPYPEFPTDVQPQMMALLSIINGHSSITETVFENRFLHVKELNKMGADISVSNNTAYIKGVKGLFGSKVVATDLRAGAAMILAALAANGETEIMDINHIDRGYYKIESKLNGLGAHIYRIDN